MTRTITGTILKPDGTVYTTSAVRFRLDSEIIAGTSVIPANTISVTTDNVGAFSVALEVPASGTARYGITVIGATEQFVNLAAGAPVTLATLLTIPAATGQQDALQTVLDDHIEVRHGEFAVEAYGAAGDGVTDDTTAFADAIAAATAVGGKVTLQAKTYKITTLTLTDGVAIEGVNPTIVHVANTPPDLDVRPLGGTWLDCSGGVGFTGNGIRGLRMENIGFTNFSKAMSFGGDGIEGASISEFINIKGVGSSTVNVSDIGIENYNFERMHTESTLFFNVNTLFRLVNQNNWCDHGNSVFDDAYVYTYPKSAANGNNAKGGIEILCLSPTVGPDTVFDLMTFIRPQVNSFNGDSTGAGIIIKGSSNTTTISQINMIDTDIEGDLAKAMDLDYLRNSRISIMTSPSNAAYALGSMVDDCTFESFNVSAIIDSDSIHRNVFHGFFASASTNMKGLYTPTDTELLTAKIDTLQATNLEANGAYINSKSDIFLTTANGVVRIPTDGAYKVRNQADNADLNVMTKDSSNEFYFGSDNASSGNAYFQTKAGIVMMLSKNGKRMSIGTYDDTSPLSVAGLAEHADNAAALAAGLTAGAFYRTGDVLKVVH